MKSFLNFVKENTGLQRSQGGFGSTGVELTGERAKAEAILAARGEQMYHPGGKKDDPSTAVSLLPLLLPLLLWVIKKHLICSE